MGRSSGECCFGWIMGTCGGALIKVVGITGKLEASLTSLVGPMAKPYIILTLIDDLND